MKDCHERLWAELSSLLRELKAVNGHALAVSGVRCEQSGAHILSRLGVLGPVRLTGLAHALGQDPSSVSRQVTALERAGLVARERDPEDLRAQRLTLTDRGRDVLSEVQSARHRALERLTPGWSRDDLDDLTSRLARFNHDLDANRDLLVLRQESAS